MKPSQLPTAGNAYKVNSYLEYREKTINSVKSETNDLVSRVSGGSLATTDKKALLFEMKVAIEKQLFKKKKVINT